jgi:DNA-binding NtrC family response regulator
MDPSRHVALVVDDEASMRELARRILERDRWIVLQAEDATDALRVLGEHPEVDLLITDVNMPEISGVRLAAIAHRRRGDLKVLYITGFPDLVFADLSALPEHEAYLEKPFTAKALVEAARLLVFGTIQRPTVEPE